MPVAFYDNREPLDDPNTAVVDRVYCLDFHRFGDKEWTHLSRVYRELPGWCDNTNGPFRFGTNDHDIPHLYASVEPSGLHICGILPVTDWLRWSSEFANGISELSAFDCE
jgi:hypothetical protein